MDVFATIKLALVTALKNL